VSRRIETRADPTDYLAVHDDRKAALHFDESPAVAAAVRPGLMASSRSWLGFLNSAAVRAFPCANSTLAR
jgi:hypothetical protein